MKKLYYIPATEIQALQHASVLCASDTKGHIVTSSFVHSSGNAGGGQAAF
jgi:hypothetical protein